MTDMLFPGGFLSESNLEHLNTQICLRKLRKFTGGNLHSAIM